MPEGPKNYEPSTEQETPQIPSLENFEINLFELTSSTSDVEDVFTEEVKINFEGQPINIKIVRNITDKKENGEIDAMYTVFYPTSGDVKRRGMLAVEVENKNGIFMALSNPMDHPNDFESMNVPMVKLFVPNIVQRLANKSGLPITLTVSLRGVKRNADQYIPMLQEQGYSKKPEREYTPWEEWEKVYAPQLNQ